MYWGMIIADPQTLLKAENRIPIVLDLLLHGCNFLINLLEHLIIDRKVNDRDKLIGWKFFFIFSVVYTVVIKVVSYYFNFHAYPIVQIMNFPLMIFLNVVAMLIMLIGEFIYNNISMMGMKKILIEGENVK
jgi:hypothetical protein